jgi:hypothetical protein
LRRRFSPGLPLSVKIFEKFCLIQTIFYLLYRFFTLQGLIVSITGVQTGRVATLQACKSTWSPKSPDFGQNRVILDSKTPANLRFAWASRSGKCAGAGVPAGQTVGDILACAASKF